MILAQMAFVVTQILTVMTPISAQTTIAKREYATTTTTTVTTMMLAQLILATMESANTIQ